MKYFKCSKCGQAMIKLENGETNNHMCISPVSYRTSGICGGAFDNEITEEEYNETIIGWERQRNDKKI